jgi:UDP-2,4-diacetamido-2,4,6-trideoxy-beta-L-altropyranose hydrolase
MKVLFRTDASLDIGTGHVMRCLTLAEALRDHGAHCRFICRSHPGNLVREIKRRGFEVCELPFDGNWKGAEATLPTHAAWLGADWTADAEQTKVGAGETAADWLIVDHYALDARWEHVLAPHCRKLMVIDDLADRAHACDLLLDQTFARDAADYRPLVPDDCHLLCGSQYALLRPGFTALRPYSLQRRARLALRELLVTMGGVDKDNATGWVLQALRTCPLPADCQITVVMGATAPWLGEIRKQAQDMPWPTRVLVSVSDMAQLMADSDLAIGAAGATSWERCCLGVPTIMLVLAKNQRKIAQELERSGGIKLIELGQNATTQLREQILRLVDEPAQLLDMTNCAASIVDGSGTNAVISKLEVAGE